MATYMVSGPQSLIRLLQLPFHFIKDHFLPSTLFRWFCIVFAEFTLTDEPFCSNNICTVMVKLAGQILFFSPDGV